MPSGHSTRDADTGGQKTKPAGHTKRVFNQRRSRFCGKRYERPIMEYAHNAFALEALRRPDPMRGSPFLDAAWYGDLDYIEYGEEHFYAVKMLERAQPIRLFCRDPLQHSPDGCHV